MSPEAARVFFPRGLRQPEGSFRFSLDALLLASFIVPRAKERLLDLGTGCGVVALAMLCRCPEMEAVGLEIQPELVAAAKENASRLGFGDRFTVVRGDVAAAEIFLRAWGAFDIVLANPPYRQRHRGRLPASRLRLTALFEEEGGPGIFCNAAGHALASGGRFGVIFPAARCNELLSVLTGVGLEPVRLLPVHARETEPPMLVLAEAIKTASAQVPGERPAPPAGGIKNDAPLVLYTDRGARTALTEQALAFCPFLACNRVNSL